jgi:hydroxyethylthiazole kinase-like uncharacterized protein yjeF
LIFSISIVISGHENSYFRGMKIVSADTMRKWDAYTIAHEPVSSIDLMERASGAVAARIMELETPSARGFVICGAGNNGGDGLAVTRILLQNNYNCECFIPADLSKASPAFMENLQRLGKMGKEPRQIAGEELSNCDYIVDALFGNGLGRPLEGQPRQLAESINHSGKSVYSIDLPSGMQPDIFEPLNPGSIVKATKTLTFQALKKAFFFHGAQAYTGEVEVLDIHLHKSFTINDSWNCLTGPYVGKWIEKRSIFSEKRDFGTTLLLGGAAGMSGAIILAAKACLRSGPGLTTVYACNEALLPIQCTVPEAICLPSGDAGYLSSLPAKLDYTAIGIGPGLGTNEATASMLRALMRMYAKPVVLDADALNLIAAHKMENDIPPASILTPHRREFGRLFGPAPSEAALLGIQMERSATLKVYIILKGAYSRLTTPDGRVFINTTGNPGMAKGGSGDVLTGIITGLLARHNDPEKAAVMGMYLHGLAGDLALLDRHEESLLPGDLIDHLPQAFHKARRDYLAGMKSSDTELMQ